MEKLSNSHYERQVEYEEDSNRPELVFWEENKEEIKQITQPFIDRFKPEDAALILDINDNSPSFARKALAYLLAKNFHIQTPDIEYDSYDSEKINPQHVDALKEKISADDEFCSSYNYKNNTIYLAIDAENPTEESDLELLSTVAHEMWHAHQIDCILKKQPRATKYIEEIKLYNGKLSSGQSYLSQFYEMEAYWFGYCIKTKINNSKTVNVAVDREKYNHLKQEVKEEYKKIYEGKISRARL